jgi:hypothetical protein
MEKNTWGTIKSDKAQVARRNLLMIGPEIERLTILYKGVVFSSYKVNWAVSDENLLSSIWVESKRETS